MPARKRYRIRFAGSPSKGLVAWLQRLIPVLREAPRDIEVDIEITSVKEADDPDRHEPAA